MKSVATRNVLVALALVGLMFAPANVQAGFWFDHPYPDVDWLVLETEHFRIYYYPDVEWSAKMMAKYAEIAYPKVTGLFDFPLKEKIHIVVRDQEDYANGFAAYMFDLVTVWSTPGYWIMRGRQEWIPDVFTHEFAHIVSLKAHEWKSEGAVVAVGSGLVEDGVHNIDFGAQLLIGRSSPFFWIEGIAEYGTHMSGFNWWTSSRDMVQRMSMLDDNYLDYEQMFEVYSREAALDRERGYQQGYSMGLYVMEKYGKEKYAQLALNAQKKGHLVWEKNIEEVLGIDGQKLFDGYLKWMKDRYARQAAPIRKAEHLGREFMITSKEEEIDIVEKLPDGRYKVQLGKRHYQDPEPEDEEEAKEMEEARKKEKPKYEYWDKSKRKSVWEKDQYRMYPMFSPDGKYFVYGGRRAVYLVPLKQEEWPFFSGRYLNKKKNEQIAEDTKTIRGASVFAGFDLSPDGKKLLFSSLMCPDTWLPCINLDGYYRWDLYEYDIEEEEVEKLTNRLRSVTPAYSPDGKQIAFVRHVDGQNFLGILNTADREVAADGTCEVEVKENGSTAWKEEKDCVKWLIKKHDGTQLGKPSWSPDGSKIVIDLYRHGQQDVWILNVDGSGLRPLTWDKAEDRDGQFVDAKHVMYSSDRTGIFNIYKLNIETGEVKQLTNVLGGTFTPHMTKTGDILFGYFNSYGVKPFAIKKEDFYNKSIDAGYEVTPAEVARNLAYEEPLPEIKEHSTTYNPFNPANWSPPIGIPMFIYETKGLQVGGQMILVDALDKHYLFGTLLMGQRQLYAFSYINNFWYPSFRVGWAHLDLGYEFAQGLGFSQQAATRSEAHFEPPMNYKNRQSLDFAWAGVSYNLAPRIGIDASYVYRHLTSKRSTGGKEQAFLTNNSYELSLQYADVGSSYFAENDINPRGGRKVNLNYLFVRSGLPSKDWADVEWLGRTNPPGDNSDDYTFHEIQLGYTEYIPVTWWNEAGKHTLELHLRAGWQNRNVSRFDEFFAGSLHPLRYVPTHSSTNEFAGYEDFTLGGETMLIAGVTYRFPIARRIDKKFGPFYFVSVWGEFSGTAGNLWGYTADYMRDNYGNIMRNDESYYDPKIVNGTIRREVPFVDIASKNGNYILYDVSFTLKLKAFIFGTTGWNSFFRVAYGLNDVIGQYEMNDDYVYVDAYPNNFLYAESEPKSLRISIGIGSNFQ
jgi:hypothetical protein